MSKNAIEKARKYLQKEISRAQQSKTWKLPPLSTMTEQAGVSRTTMSKAVKERVQRGELKTHYKWGTLLPDFVPPPKPQKQAAGSKWQKISRTIQQSIYNGDYPVGTVLPSQKELCHSFKAHHSTVAKALNELQQKKLLSPYHRSYKVTQQKVEKKAHSVVLIYRTNIAVGSSLFKGDFQTQFYNYFNSECRNRELSIQGFLLKYEGKRLTPVYSSYGDIAKSVKTGSSLGFVILSTGIYTPHLKQVTSIIGSFGAPIAIIDETASVTLADTGLPASQVRIFRLAKNRTAGEEVMRYLLSQGHTKIAFATLYKNENFSRERLSGCQNIIEKSGSTVQLVHTLNRNMSVQDRSLNLMLQTKSEHEQFYEALNSFKNSNTKILKQMYAAVTAQTGAVGRLISENERRIAAESLVKDLLKIKELTALICIEDELAHFMRIGLNNAGIKIPEDLSVISFDDDHFAVFHNLTSYNMNASGAVHSCLAWILNTHSLFRDHEKCIVQIDGFISERISVKGKRKGRRGRTSLNLLHIKTLKVAKTLI